MDAHTSSALATTMTGATLGQTFVAIVSQNSTFITTISIALTAVAGIAFGIWGKIQEERKMTLEARKVKAAERQARATERHAIGRLVTKFKEDGKDTYTQDELLSTLRENNKLRNDSERRDFNNIDSDMHNYRP